MAATKVKQGRVKTALSYVLFFQEKDEEEGCGFSFPCDEQGNPLWNEMRGLAAANCRLLMGGGSINGRNGFLPGRVEKREWWCREESLFRCECGEEFEGGSFTYACKCGRHYNWAGQDLAHPSLWGEETGEHPADLMNL